MIAQPFSRQFAVVAFCAALSLLATSVGAQPDGASSDIETIIYSATDYGLCHQCYVVKFTATSAGEMKVETEVRARGAAPGVVSHETRRITTEQFASLRERLAPFRASPGLFTLPTKCDGWSTDGGFIHVTWRGGGTDEAFSIYTGCTLNHLPGAASRLHAIPSNMGIIRPAER